MKRYAVIITYQYNCICNVNIRDKRVEERWIIMIYNILILDLSWKQKVRITNLVVWENLVRSYAILAIGIQEPSISHLFQFFLNISRLESWWVLLLQIYYVFSSHFHTNNNMGAKGVNKPAIIVKSNSWPESQVQIWLQNKWNVG